VSVHKCQTVSRHSPRAESPSPDTRAFGAFRRVNCHLFSLLVQRNEAVLFNSTFVNEQSKSLDTGWRTLPQRPYFFALLCDWLVMFLLWLLDSCCAFIPCFTLPSQQTSHDSIVKWHARLRMIRWSLLVYDFPSPHSLSRCLLSIGHYSSSLGTTKCSG